MHAFYATILIIDALIFIDSLFILNSVLEEVIANILTANLISICIFLISCLLLKKFQQNWLKKLTIIANTCLTIFLIFNFLYLDYKFIDPKDDMSNPNNCYQRLLKRTRYPEAIEHFPRYVPDEYKNISCMLEESFHGYDIYVLKFDADKYVADGIIKNLKDKIDKRYELDGISKYYKYLEGYSSFEIESKDEKNYYVYIMKNPYEEKHYVSEIIAPKEKGKLVFFYANWNIENTY